MAAGRGGGAEGQAGRVAVVDYEHTRPEPRFARERDWEAIAFGAVMVVGLLLLLWFVIIPYFRASAA